MLEGAKARWVLSAKAKLDPKNQEGLGHTSVVKLQDLSFFGMESPGSNEAGRVPRGYLTGTGSSHFLHRGKGSHSQDGYQEKWPLERIKSKSSSTFCLSSSLLGLPCLSFLIEK